MTIRESWDALLSIEVQAVVEVIVGAAIVFVVLTAIVIVGLWFASD